MFHDCSQAISANPPAWSAGVAAADVDGDGAIEFFVCGHVGPNRVLKWNGTLLQDVAPHGLADAGSRNVGIAFADVDGDGREELYLLTGNEIADQLLDAGSHAGWTDLFARLENHGLETRAASRAVVAIDRRGTGRYAFVVAAAGRPLRLFEVTPQGALADLAPSLDLAQTVAGRGVLAAPLVGDRTDVLGLNRFQANVLFRNTGVGTFLEVAAHHGLDDAAENGCGAVAVDADGDGRLDVCYGNRDGPHRLMIRQPDGTFRDRATPALAFPSAVRAVVAADFDNDGFEELFFLNHGEPNRMFRFQPGGRRESAGWLLVDAIAAADPDGYATGAAVADIDDDGRLELLIANGETAAQPLNLYKGPRTGNAWLRVKPLTRFGAPARGTVVRLTAAGRTQVRVIDGTGQTEPVAHFGLGRDPVVDAVTVTWPDGATTTLDGPHPLQTVTAPYPGG